LVLLLVGKAEAELSRGEIEDLAFQAGQLFRQANDLVQNSPVQARELYDQAILRYRRIVTEAGLSNHYLYYNIANAYLLKGDLGRAILNYRRSRRLAPSFTDLAKNLDFARSKRLDQVPVKAQKRVMHTLFFWHYDFSTKAKFILACILWAAACLAGSVWIWWRRIRWVMGCALLVGLILGGSVAVDAYDARTNMQGVIVADSVIARQGDGKNYPASFKEPLHSGTEFDLIEKRSNWLQIELGSGDQTWIRADAAVII